MIATTLYGGLGNQMFLYAAVRAAALRNETAMAFNLKQGFIDDVLFQRRLELHHFQLDLPQNAINSFDIPCGKYIRYISRRLRFNILNPRMKFIIETKMPQGWRCESKNAYLEGYWGKEFYFSDYAETIRRDFTIKKEYVTTEVRKELDKIISSGSTLVFIGVRRYQECAKITDIPKGGLGEGVDYYKRAINHIKNNVKNPVFWVFSQDQQWFKDNIDDGCVRINYAQPKVGPSSAIEDMYLMTQCSHAIISYSTYYWWAAWLINNRDKIVICPPSYKNNGGVCNGWICLE